MKNFEHIICPVCHKQLLENKKSLTCESLHSFDVAGKGYINLLLSQDKNSKDPGDNKEMAKARKRFLDKGYYSPLSDGLSELFSQRLISSGTDSVLLDAGCGDGYYTNNISKSLFKASIDCSIYGIDISKDAVRLAAGRSKEICFIVASLFKIPLMSETSDFILNAFAPANDSEFRRVLKEGGSLVTVIPGKRHLYELKSVLYERPYENDEKEPELPSFRLEEQVRINGFIELNSREDIDDLLTMTPYYWRTPREGIERLNKLDRLGTKIEFIIGVHKKHPLQIIQF